MICKLFYTIILITGFTGSLGDALDLIQERRWFPFGFGLLIRRPNPQRATLAHIGCAYRATSLHSNRQHSMDPHRCLETTSDPLLGWWWCAWYTMPNRPHRSPTLLAGVPRLTRCHGSVHSTTRALIEDLQASLIHMETHGAICVPPHPLGAPQVYYLESKWPPPYPSYSEDFIPHCGTSGYY